MRLVEDSGDAKVGTYAKVAEIAGACVEQWEDTARTEVIEWDFGEHPHLDWCQMRQRTGQGKITCSD